MVADVDDDGIDVLVASVGMVGDDPAVGLDDDGGDENMVGLADGEAPVGVADGDRKPGDLVTK